MLCRAVRLLEMYPGHQLGVIYQSPITQRLLSKPSLCSNPFTTGKMAPHRFQVLRPEKCGNSSKGGSPERISLCSYPPHGGFKRKHENERVNTRGVHLPGLPPPLVTNTNGTRASSRALKLSRAPGRTSGPRTRTPSMSKALVFRNDISERGRRC